MLRLGWPANRDRLRETRAVGLGGNSRAYISRQIAIRRLEVVSALDVLPGVQLVRLTALCRSPHSVARRSRFHPASRIATADDCPSTASSSLLSTCSAASSSPASTRRRRPDSARSTRPVEARAHRSGVSPCAEWSRRRTECRPWIEPRLGGCQLTCGAKSISMSEAGPLIATEHAPLQEGRNEVASRRPAAVSDRLFTRCAALVISVSIV